VGFVEGMAQQIRSRARLELLTCINHGDSRRGIDWALPFCTSPWLLSRKVCRHVSVNLKPCSYSVDGPSARASVRGLVGAPTNLKLP